jgi:NitT/TauT family transport system substrate-binding protein
MKKSLTVLSLLLSSCLAQQNPTVIKYVGLQVYDPVYIAMENGFFEQEGIEVEIVSTVAGGATAVQMVSSGQVQGALVSTMAIINSVAAGLPIIGVADIQSSFEEAPLEEFFVLANSGINTIQDLAGKKIAINLVKSSFHYTWLMALQNAGMLDTDVTFVTLPFAQQEEALLQGSVDAIGLIQPWTKRTRDNELVKTLLTGVDVFGERQFCEIFVNKVWAENNVADAKAFTTAIARAANWTKDNQAEAKEMVSKYTGIDVDMIDDYIFQPNGQVVVEDAQFWLDYMKANHGTPSWVTADMIVTNQYNNLL